MPLVHHKAPLLGHAFGVPAELLSLSFAHLLGGAVATTEATQLLIALCFYEKMRCKKRTFTIFFHLCFWSADSLVPRDWVKHVMNPVTSFVKAFISCNRAAEMVCICS